MTENKEFIGKIVEDPYGSYDDCSPGIYIDSENGSDECLAGRRGNTLFSEFVGRRVKITIEVLPELESEDEEITINVKLSEVINSGYWESFCDWKGWGYWIVNEGRADSSEKVKIPISKARAWGLI